MAFFFPTQQALILASGSAIRRTLLHDAGIEAEAMSVDVDEAALRQTARENGASTEELARLLAHAKAQKAAETAPDDRLIIAADQVLECDGHILSKPTSLDEARRHLRLLRGRPHTLYTAVVLWQGNRHLWHHVSTPRLTMRYFTDDFLEFYLSQEWEEIRHCVGAYRIEGPGIHLFTQIEGDMDAILGLPRLPLLEALRHYGGLMI